MTRDDFSTLVADWFNWIAAPLLAVYAIGIPVLAQAGYTWHPYVSLTAAFVSPISAALASGYFFRRTHPEVKP